MNLVPTHLRHHSAGAIFKNIQDSKPNLRSTLRRCLKGVESGCKLTCASRCAALASKPSNGSDDSYPDTARGLANGFFFVFALFWGVQAWVRSNVTLYLRQLLQADAASSRLVPATQQVAWVNAKIQITSGVIGYINCANTN